VRNRKFVAAVASVCTAGLVVGVGSIALAGKASAYRFPVGNYEVNLTGAKVFPGPGDPDGTAVARIKVLTKRITVCVTIKKAFNIALPSTGVHIHFGNSTSVGPIVVPFVGQVTAKASRPGGPAKPGRSRRTCGSLTALSNDGQLAMARANSMVNSPQNWYLSVSNSQFPGGAIRAQFSG
jgi:hypothetical protein